ncbi:uncharacterized protein LOC102713256 [Oryza brachyantha]|uniref:uncharacterized protein LOC102713256 n=1 Tax=Oryza brachyantha TaxID=4533 RepID=UPI001ADAE13D|nr:uncharacterized protein LOC102713256 [Oryza brachyantha]
MSFFYFLLSPLPSLSSSSLSCFSRALPARVGASDRRRRQAAADAGGGGERVHHAAVASGIRRGRARAACTGCSSGARPLFACLHASSSAADRLAVACVKHECASTKPTKMDGAIQTVYPRKNWSSMVLYNCGHPKSTQTDAFLHRFAWHDDDEIGEIPFAWHFLVGHNKVNPSTQPKAIHYTSGGPWFERYKNCDFTELWIKEAEELKADKEKEKQQQLIKANGGGEEEKKKEGNLPLATAAHCARSPPSLTSAAAGPRLLPLVPTLAGSALERGRRERGRGREKRE